MFLEREEVNGQPKKSLKEVIKYDLSFLGLSKEVALDRAW